MYPHYSLQLGSELFDTFEESSTFVLLGSGANFTGLVLEETILSLILDFGRLSSSGSAVKMSLTNLQSQEFYSESQSVLTLQQCPFQALGAGENNLEDDGIKLMEYFPALVSIHMSIL